MDNHNEIDNILYNRLNGFEIQPQPASFELVLRKVAVKRKRRRAAVIFTTFGVMGLTFLLLTQILPVEQSPRAKDNLLGFTKENDPATESNRTQHKVALYQAIPSAINRTKDLPGQGGESPAALALPEKPPVSYSRVGDNCTNKQMLNKSDNPVFASGALSETARDTLSSGPTLLSLKDEPVLILASQPVGDKNGLGITDLQLSDTVTYNITYDLLNFNARRHEPTFFIGLTYTPLLYSYRFNKPGGRSGIYQTGYKDDFRDFYLEKRKNQNRFYMAGIPGIRLGIVHRNKIELSVGAGYYKLSDKETVLLPPADTSNRSITSQPVIVPFNVANPVMQNGRSLTPTEMNNKTFRNEYRYIYGSIDMSCIFNFGTLKFKPGATISFNRVIESSYVLLIAQGYSYQEKSTLYLQTTNITLAVKAGVATRLFKKLDAQLSPLLLYSPTSVYDRKYFISQKMYGFGLEAALLWRIP